MIANIKIPMVHAFNIGPHKALGALREGGTQAIVSPSFDTVAEIEAGEAVILLLAFLHLLFHTIAVLFPYAFTHSLRTRAAQDPCTSHYYRSSWCFRRRHCIERNSDAHSERAGIG